MQYFCCLLLLLALAGGYSTRTTAATVVEVWKVEAIAAFPAEWVRLDDKNKKPISFVKKTRAQGMLDAMSRLQAASGIRVEFLVFQMSDHLPNAFATVVKDRNIVGITPAMVELLGDDIDSYAAVLSHELAHIAKQHGAERSARQGALQGIGLIASLLIGARTGVNVGGLVDLGTSIVDRSFTRDEERDADRLGFDYMMSAGFDPAGAIRAHNKMLGSSRNAAVPFLSTHPGGEERIANFHKMIAERGIAPKATEQAGQRPTDHIARPTEPTPIALAARRTDRLESAQRDASEDPLNPRVWETLGDQYRSMGQFDYAIQAFERARQLDPDNASILEELGFLYARAGQHDRLAAVWTELGRLSPIRAERFFSLYILPQ